MNIVYIVKACTDYEGSDNVKAFMDKCLAEKFMQQCDEHRLLRPSTPENDDDKSWEAFDLVETKWANAHPDKANRYCDNYRLEEVELTSE